MSVQAKKTMHAEKKTGFQSAFNEATQPISPWEKALELSWEKNFVEKAQLLRPFVPSSLTVGKSWPDLNINGADVPRDLHILADGSGSFYRELQHVIQAAALLEATLGDRLKTLALFGDKEPFYVKRTGESLTPAKLDRAAQGLMGPSLILPALILPALDALSDELARNEGRSPHILIVTDGMFSDAHRDDTIAMVTREWVNQNPSGRDKFIQTLKAMSDLHPCLTVELAFAATGPCAVTANKDIQDVHSLAADLRAVGVNAAFTNYAGTAENTHDGINPPLSDFASNTVYRGGAMARDWVHDEHRKKGMQEAAKPTPKLHYKL